MITKRSLQKEIRTIQSIIGKLADYTEKHNDLHFNLDEYLQQLDCKVRDIESKLYMLECKIEFLNHNKDAIEMWIECVRQTQQLYEESQQQPAATDE